MRPSRHSVADRILQNVNGIELELAQLRRTLAEESQLLTSSERLRIERSLQKLASESDIIRRVVSDAEEAPNLRIAG